jgi:hypothetical protein
MDDEQELAGKTDGTAVFADLKARYGAGFKTNWCMICRVFGFDPATTTAIYGVAATAETEIEGRTHNPPTPPRPVPREDELIPPVKAETTKNNKKKG